MSHNEVEDIEKINLIDFFCDVSKGDKAQKLFSTNNVGV